ncbi:DNA excision repair protein ERCC-6 [Trichonephila clavipes]|uniref:DNA repair and recombination protein RAD54-like n=1 Tax=Trichonephila clavipes TaxID=2585209 RepID=A0A8X6RA34_TRICX|nr:DNA excision repair protein ERCC-6 [Trichonephila clavipes]
MVAEVYGCKLLASIVELWVGALVPLYACYVERLMPIKQGSKSFHEHGLYAKKGCQFRIRPCHLLIAQKYGFRTPHRLILSDSPIQNNLKELWSLFDFIFPGKLGTLPVFMQEFSVPIMFGGYSNATQVQVQILAYKFATVLRDTIKPYLLRRMKSDVQIPYKNEQVLFCKLTKDQEELYKGYINSKEVESILSARLEVFIGLKNLRKICNHPDIFGGPKIFKDTDEDRYGYYEKSGKMVVVEALLGLWRKQGHRVLLFTQSKQMLEIFEIFVKSKNYKYMKMDGTTSISSRQPAVAKFNSDSNIFVFLLTTRVRGIGVNLTGADRIIIYDSDWNPVTDALAREPSWGIDQSKQVAVYWLLTAGTIEEKNYHRQIFKRFMTDRGIKDPKQRRFFESTDLYELFTYQDVGKQDTETSAILGTTFEINLKKKVQEKNKKYPKEQKSKPRNSTDVAVFFSKKKQEEMKMLAKKLSQQLPKCNFPKSSETSLSVDSETTKELDGNGCNSTPSAESQSVEKPLKEKSGEKTLKGSLKRKAAKVEGEIIDYVVKKKVFKPTEEDKDEHKNEDYILSKFEKSGVHTALKHDVVELSAPDYSIVKNEADRVASEAIKALKASRTCVPAAEEIPTGTDNMLD